MIGSTVIIQIRYQTLFHFVAIEGYLHGSSCKTVLSRVTEVTDAMEPFMAWKDVSEGRSFYHG